MQRTIWSKITSLLSATSLVLRNIHGIPLRFQMLLLSLSTLYYLWTLSHYLVFKQQQIGTEDPSRVDSLFTLFVLEFSFNDKYWTSVTLGKPRIIVVQIHLQLAGCLCSLYLAIVISHPTEFETAYFEHWTYSNLFQY